jgi:hypothetical protein
MPPASPAERLWWDVIVFAVGVYAGASRLSDNSFLTHLATGRLIRSGLIPHRDVFTFESAGRHTVVQSWLASWWYATLESIGGAGLIRCFVAAVSGLLAWLVWRLSAPATALVGRLALVTGALVVGLIWWNERPQLIAFVLFCLAALVMVERKSRWWLVPIFGLWVNIHGSFPLGLAVVGAFWLISMADSRQAAKFPGKPGTRESGDRESGDRESGDRESVREGRGWMVPGIVDGCHAMCAGMVGTVAGAAVSPYGMELVTFPLGLLRRSDSLIFMSEWRPLAASGVSSVVFLAVSVASRCWCFDGCGCGSSWPQCSWRWHSWRFEMW